MEDFVLSERYRLELHWDRVDRPKPGRMVFKNAYFSGPVLQQALKLNDNDKIVLDFCDQHFVLVKNIYIADLSWGKVIYEDKIIRLQPAIMEFDPKLKNIPSLKDKDYLVINTEDHEVSKHIYNISYPALVVSSSNELYDYRR